MKKFLLHWIVMVIALVVAGFLTNMVLPGQFQMRSDAGGVALLFVGVLVLSLLNATIGRVLKFMTMPLNCLTLGLASLLINAILVLVAGNLGLGFRVDNFLGAFLVSILYSAVNGILTGLLDKKEEKREE